MCTFVKQVGRVKPEAAVLPSLPDARNHAGRSKLRDLLSSVAHTVKPFIRFKQIFMF